MLIARQIAPGIGQRGLIFCQLPLSLGQLNLERPGIDFRQQIAGFDLLAFGKVDRHQLAIDPAGDGHGIGGGGGAQAGKIARHRLAGGGRRLHRRHRCAASAAAARPAPVLPAAWCAPGVVPAVGWAALKWRQARTATMIAIAATSSAAAGNDVGVLHSW